MVSRSLHQGSVNKCGRQDTVRREMWLQKGHYVIHCSQCAQQDKVESEQWIATKESPPWQPGHSRRSSCQENMLETHPRSGRSVSSKIGPSQRAGIQRPIRAGRGDVDLQGQSQAVGSGMGTGSVDRDTEAEAQTPLSPRVEASSWQWQQSEGKPESDACWDSPPAPDRTELTQNWSCWEVILLFCDLLTFSYNNSH